MTPSGQRWGRAHQGAGGLPVPAKDISLFLTGPKTEPVPEIPASAIPPSDLGIPLCLDVQIPAFEWVWVTSWSLVLSDWNGAEDKAWS